MNHSTVSFARLRYCLAAAVGLLSFSIPSFAQVTLVHVTSCNAPASTCAIPSTGTGNVLVVGWTASGDGTTISTVTDSAGNVYEEAGSARATDTAGNTMADIWYVENSLPGATTVTITPSPSGTSGTAVIWEFSGIEPFSPLDQTAVLNSQAATTTPVGAAVTTTSPAEVVVSVANVQGSVTGISSGNSFTSDSTASGDGWAHFVASSAGTYAPQWTNSTAGTYCSSTVSFRVASTGAGACDLNQDGVVNVVDVQLSTNMYLGTLVCPVSLNGGCGSALPQAIVNAALGEGCTITISHSVSLTWTASSSPSISGYNVYRSTTSGGSYSQINSSLVTTTSYTDTNVSAGQTYYYVTTAVNTSNEQSGYSNQAQATVPTDL